MFKPPFGLYCPLFRSSSYPAPMTPESRTDFSSNQSKNPFFWPGCVACVARSRHPSVARSRSPSSPPRSLPSPQSRDRPFATQHRPPPEVARSIDIDRRVAVLSPIAASRARPRGRSIARARRSRASRARVDRASRAPPRAPRGLDRGRGRDGFRIKPSGALRTLPAAAFFPATRFVPDVFAAFTTTRVELTANMCLGGGGARV